MSHQYKLTYELTAHPKGLSEKRVREMHDKKGGLGACDAGLFASLIYQEDGSLSCYFLGVDGRTGGILDDTEWFKVWALLSARLSESEVLDPVKKGMCATCLGIVRGVTAANIRETTDEKTK